MTVRYSYRAGLMAAILLLGGSGAPALLADPPAGAARVSGEQEGMLQVKGGKLPEGPVEIRQEGAVTGFARGPRRHGAARAGPGAERRRDPPTVMPEPRVSRGAAGSPRRERGGRAVWRRDGARV